MGRPIGTVPTWATDTTVSAGPDTGEATRLEPSAGARAQGHVADTRTAARVGNWLHGGQGDFIAYLDAIPAKNWFFYNLDAEFTSDNDAPRIVYAEVNSNVFVAGALSGGLSFVVRSVAGHVWHVVTPTGLGSDTTITDIIWAEGALLLAGDGPTIGENIRRSTDFGTNWSTIAAHTDSDGYASFAYDGVNFYATPNALLEEFVGVSATGAAWAATTGTFSFPWNAVGGASIRAGSGTGRLLVFSQDTLSLDRVLYSSDAAATWTQSAAVSGTAGNAIADVRYDSELALWVALVRTATGWRTSTSADHGATWTAQPESLGSDAGPRLAIHGGLWVVAFSNSTPRIAYSTDVGQTWTQVVLGTGDDPPPVSMSVADGQIWILAKESAADQALWRSLKV